MASMQKTDSFPLSCCVPLLTLLDTQKADEEDHVASFKRMLDDILDTASSDSLTHGLEPGVHGRIGVVGSGSSFLSSPSAAVSRARLNTNTTLGFLLPQPKGHFTKLKNANRSEILLSEGNVDQHLLHKLEEQNSLIPPQVKLNLTKGCVQHGHFHSNHTHTFLVLTITRFS